MQSPCAHDVLHYTAQALRAREKRAVVLPHAFGLLAIVAEWAWCASTRGGRGVRDARAMISALHVSKVCMQSSCAHDAPTILPRRYAPAKKGWICWIRSLSDVAETWWDAGGIFACPDIDSFSDIKTGRGTPRSL
jgi:hypothetical protein